MLKIMKTSEYTKLKTELERAKIEAQVNESWIKAYEEALRLAWTNGVIPYEVVSYIQAEQMRLSTKYMEKDQGE